MSKQIFANFLKQNKMFEEFKKEVESQNKLTNQNFKSLIDEVLAYADCEVMRCAILEDGEVFSYKDSSDRGKWNNLNIEWKRMCQ